MMLEKCKGKMGVLILLGLMFVVNTGFSQEDEQQYKLAVVSFYNIENLFDTLDDPEINDADFLPEGKFNWATKKYKNKLVNMAKVISQIGDMQNGKVKFNGPTFLGVAEIENRKVLEDLVAEPILKKSNYGIVHEDSPDHRGIDVAFLYKKDQFKVLSHSTYEYVDPDSDKKSRDQLLVTGMFEGEKMHFIINHWPSRGAPSPKRVIAAKICRKTVDSLLADDANAKIYIMGDFNDTPQNESLRYLKHKTISAKQKDKKVVKLLNHFDKVKMGTIGYQGVWSVFDMIIISPGAEKGPGYKYASLKIFDRPWIYVTDGPQAGYPKRTHEFGNYINGYSDHLPVYMYLTKTVN